MEAAVERISLLKARGLKNKKPYILTLAAGYPTKPIAYCSEVLFNPDTQRTLEQVIAEYRVHGFTDDLITEPALLVNLHCKGRLTETDVGEIFKSLRIGNKGGVEHS